MAPPSQKAADRPIAFALEDDGAIVADVTLGLRPEDFTRTDTSRTTVHHTLGGAWADSFGPGLPTMTIAGHTGWRGAADGDGESRWRALRDDVWNGWHQRRKAAVQRGSDPSMVKLLYCDGLNGFVVEVAPMSLTLRRSKSRPLLIQYQLAMTVLDQNRDQLQFLSGGEKKDTPGEEGGFFDSVTSSIGSIRDAIAGGLSWVHANLVAPVMAFIATANRVFGAVVSVIRGVVNFGQTILAIPIAFAQAGMNVMRTLAAYADLPNQARAAAMGLAAAFSNIWCFLLRARPAARAYGRYAGFYGASNCSSISGGSPVSPLAGINPFSALSGPSTTALPIKMTDNGRAGLISLASADPVNAPPSSGDLATQMNAIHGGVVVTDQAIAA